jgi:DNA-directed RNA polymerase specialized sigma24 family protein
VVHAALQRAIEHSGQLRDASRAQAWVGQIVLNVLRDELRKPRIPAVLVDNVDIAAKEDHGIDCRCALVQAQRLKPAYATILRRVVIDGAAVTTVAAELGLTPNNAMVRLHRARAALREQLKAHCGMTTAQSCSDCGCEERGCCSAPE